MNGFILNVFILNSNMFSWETMQNSIKIKNDMVPNTISVTIKTEELEK